MITGPGKDLKTDCTQHAVIFVDNLSDLFHQHIAGLASSRVIYTGEELAEFALDPVEMFDRELPVSGPRDERSNEADLQQMNDKRTIRFAAAQPLKIQSCAQYESRGFFPGHGEQQRLGASRGLSMRFSVGHSGFPNVWSSARSWGRCRSFKGAPRGAEQGILSAVLTSTWEAHCPVCRARLARFMSLDR
jgi:hypothetical protein